MKFPRIRGRNADGDRVYLPVDFEGEPTLVLLTFQWQQRAVVRAWREFADSLAEEYDDFEYAELYVTGGKSGLHPPVMTGGLGPTPGSAAGDDRLLSVRVNKRSFRRSLGLPGESTVYALLVDDEYVVRQAAGMLTRDIAEGLQSLLAEWEDAEIRWTEARATRAEAESSADE
ncbi:MAG: hypothetical protein ABEJ28_00870 [Salinigranum sp.]